ncbi:MAG: hypothetical protein LBS49_14995 [Candidatus Accumulibacter sp.]|jgi:hypothetical protein|nr:hypothetical protein [Accumulibacter sp.]
MAVIVKRPKVKTYFWPVNQRRKVKTYFAPVHSAEKGKASFAFFGRRSDEKPHSRERVIRCSYPVPGRASLALEPQESSAKSRFLLLDVVPPRPKVGFHF